MEILQSIDDRGWVYPGLTWVLLHASQLLDDEIMILKDLGGI